MVGRGFQAENLVLVTWSDMAEDMFAARWPKQTQSACQLSRYTWETRVIARLVRPQPLRVWLAER